MSEIDLHSGRFYRAIYGLLEDDAEYVLGQRWEDLVNKFGSVIALGPFRSSNTFYSSAKFKKSFLKALKAAEKCSITQDAEVVIVPCGDDIRPFLDNLSRDQLCAILSLLIENDARRRMEPRQEKQLNQAMDSILATTEGWSTEARADLIKQLEKQQVEVGGISREAAMPTIERPDAQAILRILKHEHGMTNREVAALTGKGLGTIGRISTGETVQPRLDVLEALSDLLRKKSIENTKLT
ncbi:MAG: helix-turn-helix transcriptional regulator [Planctomycetota bacterium]|nr:helix-turn-helix transcriptional regulator [Planctomycetota bacterium]